MKPPKCKVCGREHYGPCYVASTKIRLASDVKPIVIRSRLAKQKSKK